MTEEKIYKVGLISLGCDKNRVDAEKMLSRLQAAGYKISTEIEECDVVIINTCGFIEAARAESFATIEEVISNKTNQKIVVTGCLPKVTNEESLKNIDKVIPLTNNEKIVEEIDELLKCKHNVYPFETRITTTPTATAYLKISDGCNNHCSYCTIPSIRGNYKSIPMEDIILEAKTLVDCGVKELILVAQDLTRYGKDLYNEYKLVELIQRLSKLEGLKWIRLHYCYPELVTDELIEEIATNEKVCSYIDIPFQHISNRILKSMFRRNTKEEAYELIKKLKQKNIAIRSTFIVGYPGETKEEFNELIAFIKEFEFDNVGFFAYSREKGTKAYDLENQIPEKIKIKRLKKIQKIQTKILLKKQKNKKKSVIKVLCESYNPELNLYFGRDERNSFDVDTLVVFEGENVEVGNFYDVKIVSNFSIDLLGEKYEFTE